MNFSTDMRIESMILFNGLTLSAVLIERKRSNMSIFLMFDDDLKFYFFVVVSNAHDKRNCRKILPFNSITAEMSF